MCGIIGVVGMPNAAQAIIAGLKRLEYRGYDSAGLAIVTRQGLDVQRAVGAVKHLDALPQAAGTAGVGHTRWATHGPPTQDNAHPHRDCSGRIALVHNGIIDNYQELREALEARGHKFLSQTDTEVLSHLVEECYRGDLADALREAISHVEGSYAIGVVHADEPDRLVAARMKSPLIVGLTEGRALLASDATALLDHTRDVVFLEDGDLVDLRPDRIRIHDAKGEARVPVVRHLAWTLDAAEKGGFEHFMLKEIHDIPEALHELLRGRLAIVGERFDVEGALTEEQLRSVKRIVVLACGTSHYSGMVGKQVLETLAGIPVDVQLASEYRYAPALDSSDTLAILVSQSGETADTLQALRQAKERGARTLALVNVVGSSLSREADGVFYLRAGPEIGVASTKAFVNMVGAFHVLALHLGIVRGRLTPGESRSLVAELRGLPRLAQMTLDKEEEIKAAALKHFDGAKSAFFLGRQVHHGLAHEGALKLKEISYLHAEGYAAGELKHGPLALLEPGFPVVALVSEGESTHAVALSNMDETRARGARVLAIASETDEKAKKHADAVLTVPSCPPVLATVPMAVVLYLMAYHVANARGCNVDRPRNLAKSVTVE